MIILSYFQAQINIIKCNCEFFRKSSGLLKYFFLHHQACCGNCTHILKQRCLVKVSRTVCRHINKHMPCDPTHSNHASRMLNRIVRINQLRSDTADFRSLAYAKHLFHPVRLNRFHIIVQKKQIFSPGMRYTKVINSRIIKFFSPAQKMYLLISGKFFIVFENLSCRTIILYDYDFKVLIGCILL